MSSEVVILESDSLDDFQPPPVDRDGRPGHVVRQGNLRVVVVVEESKLTIQAAKVQRLVASPLVQSVLILCEVRPVADGDVHSSEASDEPNQTDTTPSLERPADLARIPILWVSDYVGHTATYDGLVGQLGAAAHAGQNRSFLHQVLSNVDVFDAVHQLMNQVTSGVAVPSLILSSDQRLAGREIGERIDSIVMALFGRSEELLRVTGTRNPRLLARHPAGLRDDVDVDVTSDDREEEPDQERDAEGEDGTGGGTYVRSLFAERVAGLGGQWLSSAEPDEDGGRDRDAERDRSPRSVSVDPAVLAAGAQETTSKGSTTSEVQATSAGPATRATDQVTARRGSFGDRLEQHAPGVIVVGLMLGLLAALTSTTLTVAGVVGGLLIGIVGAYAGLRSQQGERIRKRQLKRPEWELTSEDGNVGFAGAEVGGELTSEDGNVGFAGAEVGGELTSEDGNVGFAGAEVDQAAVQRRVERFNKEVGLLGKRLLGDLFERSLRQPTSSILQYDPYWSRSSQGLVLTTEQVVLVDQILLKHFEALIWPILSDLYHQDADRVTTAEYVRIQRESLASGYEDELSPLRPRHPKLNESGRALKLDKMTARRVASVILTGRSEFGVQPIDRLDIARQRILDERDRIVHFGLLHTLRLSEEERAEIQALLHLHFSAVSDDEVVGELLDRWQLMVDDYLNGDRGLVQLCSLAHIPVLDRAQPLPAIVYARNEVRSRMDFLRGALRFWAVDAGIDGIFGIRPVLSGAVQEPVEPWPISYVLEDLGWLHGVATRVDIDARQALVGGLSRFVVVSAMDQLLQRLVGRKVSPRLSCQLGTGEVAVTIDGVGQLDVELLIEQWPDIVDRLDRDGTSGPGLRLVIRLPIESGNLDEKESISC